MDPGHDEPQPHAAEGAEHPDVQQYGDEQRPDVAQQPELQRPPLPPPLQVQPPSTPSIPTMPPPPLPAKPSRLSAPPGAPLFVLQDPGRLRVSPEQRPRSMRSYSARTNPPARMGSVGFQGPVGPLTPRDPNGTHNIDWIVPERGPHTLGQRMQPTLTYANAELKKYQRKAQLSGWALNIAIGLQVLVGALITGLSAVVSGHNVQVSTSILGGASTVIASYLARVRGSNEPELSVQRVKDLSQFLRECDAFVQDHGYETGDRWDDRLNELRRRLEDLLGNINPQGPLTNTNREQKQPSPVSV